MNIFHSRLVQALPNVTCAFVGRVDVPRPSPIDLLKYLHPAARDPSRVVTAHQIHSNRCLLVDADVNPRERIGDGDALVTTRRDVVLGICTADCMPIIAVDAEVGVLGVVHAGWRGTLSGVLTRTLSCMITRCRARADRIIVVVGPGARRCCYSVGDEVTEQFGRSLPSDLGEITRSSGGRTFLDLVEANRLLALHAGVVAGHFETIDICSICQSDRCHSYRREGSAAGRMWLLAALVT